MAQCQGNCISPSTIQNQIQGVVRITSSEYSLNLRSYGTVSKVGVGIKYNSYDRRLNTLRGRTLHSTDSKRFNGETCCNIIKDLPIPIYGNKRSNLTIIKLPLSI